MNLNAESPAKIDEICDRLYAFPFKPMSAYQMRFGTPLVHRHFKRKLDQLCNEQGGQLMQVVQGKHAVAGVWMAAPWESRHLQLACARIDQFSGSHVGCDWGLRRLLIRQMMERLEVEGIDYAFTRLDARDIPAIQGFEQQGFQFIDSIVTFSGELVEMNLASSTSSDLQIRVAEAGDARAIQAIAEQAFRYDRFHNDPIIETSTADRMHGEWALNLLRNTAAPVLVAELDDKVVGFIGGQFNQDATLVFGRTFATIVLLAVDSNTRGNGVGKALVKAFCAHSRDKGCEYMEVGTQMVNIGASRAYLSVGFKPIQSQVTLRWFRQAK